MSRSRKKYLTPDHGKKGRFPRHHKKFDIDITDEEADSPFRMGMRKPHALSVPYDEDCRGVAADTRKMRRVLTKQVGRPWNEVQGEFLKEFDSRTFEGHTVREWLDYVVEQNVIIQKDGKITDTRGLSVGYYSWAELYVHPQTGILCLAPCERTKYVHDTPQRVFKLDSTLYHEHEGLWYRVKMKVFDKAKNWWGWGHDYSNVTDVFIVDPHGLTVGYRSSGWMFQEKYGFDPKGRGWYCVWKQSANSKEIARLKAKYFSEKKAA